MAEIGYSGGSGGTIAGFNPYGRSTPSSAGLVQSMLGGGGGIGVKPVNIWGGGAAASSGASGSASSAPATTSNVAPNPVSNGVIDQLLARSKDPTMGAGAYDLGIQKIRANASQGIGKEMAASRAARGVSGGGLDDADARGLAQMQEGQIGSLTANFLAQREDKRDQLIGQAGNMGLAQGAQQQNQQSINYGQYNADRDAAWRETSAKTNNLQNILSILSGSGLLGGNSLAV